MWHLSVPVVLLILLHPATMPPALYYSRKFHFTLLIVCYSSLMAVCLICQVVCGVSWPGNISNFGSWWLFQCTFCNKSSLDPLPAGLLQVLTTFSDILVVFICCCSNHKWFFTQNDFVSMLCDGFTIITSELRSKKTWSNENNSINNNSVL